jgi:hypothetical protein
VAVGRADIGGSVTPDSTFASRGHDRAAGGWPRSPEFAAPTGVASWSAAGHHPAVLGLVGLSGFAALTRTAVRRIEGAAAASITVVRSEGFQTIAPTDDRALQADAIQYRLTSGPCVDAIREDTVFRPADLRRDDRWSEFGQRVASRVGFLSMLSYRLHVEPEAGELIAGLNLYADRVNAFDDTAAELGLLLATHGSLAVAAESSPSPARETCARCHCRSQLGR